MTDRQDELIKFLLREHSIEHSSIDPLSDFFSGLSPEEKIEIFSAKYGLYQSVRRKANKNSLSDDLPLLGPIIDFVTFYVAVDMAKRPSQHKNKKFAGEKAPDFTEAFISSLSRKARKAPKARIIEANFRERIKQWRSDGVSWRNIAEAINKSPVKVKITHPHLKRIYDKWD